MNKVAGKQKRSANSAANSNARNKKVGRAQTLSTNTKIKRKRISAPKPVAASKTRVTKIVERDKITEYRLKNNLKVLLLPNDSAPVVTVLVLYKVGSRNEAVGFTGATHFLEHMLFKGTHKHNAEKGNGIDELLTQIGAYWNATTWFDRTSYFEVVPSEYLELCLSLEADRMRNLRLRQEDRDSEMSVVRNELERGENYPDEALEKELYAISFREHPYHHPTIGWRTDVEGVPMERLKEFYDTFYWPENATLIVVGDFKTEPALKMINKYFGVIKSAPKAIPSVYTIEPPQEGERRFEITRAGDLPRVWIGYHIPEAVHRDTYALSAIRHILGGTYERSSRLYNSLIDSGVACDSFARHYDLKDPGLFMVGAMLNPGVPISKAEDILHAELNKLIEEPVKADELKRAKVANLKGTILSKAEPNSFAFMLAESESRSDWHWLMDYDDRFEAVTASDITAVAKRYFKKENRTVGHFIPRQQDSQIAPGEKDGHELAKTDSTKKVEQAKLSKTGSDKAAKAARLEYNVPQVKVAKPKSPTTRFASRVEKKVLANGITLLLMRSPGTKSLGISGVLKAGKYFSYEKNSNLADVMVDLLPKGSINYNKMAIAQALENMGIPGALDFAVDNFRVAFGTHLVASDLDEYCKLLNDILRNPSFSEDELAKSKVEWESRFQEAMNNTKMLAWNAFRNKIYQPRHPYFEKMLADELADLPRVSRAGIIDLHKESISPSSMIISLVGDIELNQATKIVEKYFGNWIGHKALPINVPEVGIPKDTKRIEIKLADKQSVDIVMGHPCGLRRTSPDFYAARLANSALGQDTITSRLGQIVREKAGLTYGIYSSFSDTAFAGAPWSVTLSVNPNNIDRALTLVSQVLTDYLERGISKDELSKEIGRAVGSFKVGLASSLGIARALTEFEFLGLGVNALDEITDQFLGVTREAANAAAAKYMHPKQALTVIAGTF